MSSIKIGKPIYFKENSFISITSGEHSDYQTVGFYRVLKTFSDEGAVLFFKGENIDCSFPSCEQDEFIKYLIENNFIENIKYSEFHIGFYGELEI